MRTSRILSIWEKKTNIHIKAISSPKVAKKLEIPSVRNPDAIALTRHCEQAKHDMHGAKLAHEVRPHWGNTWRCCNLPNLVHLQRARFSVSTDAQDAGDCHVAVATRNDEYVGH
jgi:hypothetical protein